MNLKLRELLLEMGILMEAPEGENPDVSYPSDWTKNPPGESAPSPGPWEKDPEFVNVTPHKLWAYKGSKSSKPSGEKLFWNFYALYWLWRDIGRGLEVSYGPSPDIYSTFTGPFMGKLGKGGLASPYDILAKVPTHRDQDRIDRLFYSILRTTGDALVFYLKRACLLELQHIGYTNMEGFVSKVTKEVKSNPNFTWADFVRMSEDAYPDADPAFLMRFMGFYVHYHNRNDGISAHNKIKAAKEAYETSAAKEKADLEKWLAEPVDDKDLYDIEKEPRPGDAEEEPPEEEIPDYPHEPESKPTDIKKDPSYMSHDVYWNPEPGYWVQGEEPTDEPDPDKPGQFKKKTTMKWHDIDKSKLTEVGSSDYDLEKVESQVGLRRIKKIHDAMKKGGMLLSDIPEAYSDKFWGKMTSFGGKAWGDGMAAALELEKRMQSGQWDNKNMMEIAQAIDHIYDLDHNTGNLLNKGYVNVSQDSLDKRARMTSLAGMLPYVSPQIKQIIQHYLKFFKGGMDALKARELTNSPGVPLTPKLEEFLKKFGFYQTANNVYQGSFDWESKKQAGNKEKIIHHTTQLFIRKLADGTYLVNDEMMTDVNRFKNFGQLFKYVNSIYGSQLNKTPKTSTSYNSVQVTQKSEKDKYLESHAKVRLPSAQEEKLKTIQFGWRPNSQWYRAEAIDNNNFYMHAFSDGSFMTFRKQPVDDFKIFNNFDEMFEHLVSISSGKVNTLVPHPDLAPASSTSATGQPTPAALGKGTSVAGKKLWGFSPVEIAAFKTLIAGTIAQYATVQIFETGEGKYQVASGNKPLFTVGKVIDAAAFGKPFILHHYIGNKGESENFYFATWEEMAKFIKNNAKGLINNTSKIDVKHKMPPPSASTAEYTKSGPAVPIRLTKADEALLSKVGFEVQMGKNVYYQHVGTKDIARFFSDNTAQIQFASKTGVGGAGVKKKPILIGLDFIKSTYTKEMTKSPAFVAPLSSPIQSGGDKAGGLFEPILKKAGFVWDQSSKTYKDLTNQNSLWINPLDRSSKLTFSDGSVKQFADIPKLITYLKEKYPTDSTTKKSKPITSMDQFHKLFEMLQSYGYKYNGIEGVDANEQQWVWEDPSGQAKVKLDLHGTVTFSHPALGTEKQWPVDNFLKDFLGLKQGKPEPEDQILPLDEGEHQWAVSFFEGADPSLKIKQLPTVSGHPGQTVVFKAGIPLIVLRKKGTFKYVVAHSPGMTMPMEKFDFDNFAQVQSFLYGNIQKLLEFKPLQTSPESSPESSLEELTQEEKKWLVDAVPKKSKDVAIKSVQTIGKVKYYTNYNVLLFEVGKKPNGNYYISYFTNDGNQYHREFKYFQYLRNFINDEIDSLASGEKPKQPTKNTQWTTSEQTEILNKAGFIYIDQTEDKLGDRFKHPIGSMVIVWDDGKITYNSSTDKEGHQQLYNNFKEFYGSVLTNSAYVYKQHLESEVYTKHYYDDVAPSQNVYSIRLTEEDEGRIKKHGFEWVPSSKTHQPNRYQRGKVHAIFYNKSLNSLSKSPAVDIFNSDESGVDAGKLGSFKTIEAAIKYIEKNFPEEDGGGGEPISSVPPTTPSGEPNTFSESEIKALEILAKHNGLHIQGTPKGQVIAKGPLSENEPLYILTKTNDEYKFMWKPTKEKSEWEPVLAQYSLVKNDHITNFDEYYKYAEEIFHNIANPEKDPSINDPTQKVLKSIPSGETYKTEENAANAHRISLNPHDESLLAQHGFFWNDLDHSYTDDENNKFSFTNDGKANFYNAKEHLGTEHDTIPIALQWMIDNPDLSNYVKTITSKPLLNKYLDTISKGIKLISTEHNDVLNKYGYKWYDQNGCYYNKELDRAIFIFGEGHPIPTSKSKIYLYFVDKQNVLKKKPFESWHKLEEWLATEKSHFAGQHWAQQHHKTSKGWVHDHEHDYDTIEKDKVKKIIELYPEDAKKLSELGFELDESQGYPLYVNKDTSGKVAEHVAFYNDDSAYYMDVSLNQAIQFFKDGTAIQKQTEWGKPAPLNIKKGGVQNAIASILAWHGKNETNAKETYRKLLKYMSENTGIEDVETLTKWPKDKKIEAIKQLRNFFYEQTGQSASLFHSKVAIENWPKFLKYVRKRGWPNMLAADQGSIDVWLSAPDDDVDEEAIKLLESIGFQYAKNETDMDGSPISVYQNAEGDELHINKDGEVAYFVNVMHPSGAKKEWTGGWENVESAVADFKVGNVKDPESIEGEPQWEDLKKAIKDAGFVNPKKIKTITGTSAVEYYNPDQSTYLVYLPDGSSYTTTQSPIAPSLTSIDKSFNKPEQLYGYLKGDPKYTGKAWGGGEKPPFPTKLEKEYIGKATQPIKLIGNDHKLMEDMGFDLTFSTNPIYSRGQMEVQFWSDDSALVSVGGKTDREFLSLNGGILACLQWLYEEIWGAPNLSPVIENQLKAMGFKQFGNPTKTGITFIKHDKKYTHMVDIRFKDNQMEYTKTQNKLPNSKIIEKWIRSVEKGMAHLQNKITSFLPSQQSTSQEDLTTERLKKLGYKYVGKSKNGSYWYTKHTESSHGTIHYQITISPSPHMKFEIYMKGKDGNWVPMTTKEWDDIEAGLKQVEDWESGESVGKKKTNELLDYQNYPNPEKYYNKKTGGYKSGSKMKLRIKDHQAVLSKGFEWISDPNSAEYNEYHHPNGDWFFIQSNGTMKYSFGSMNAGTTIKEGFSMLKGIYFQPHSASPEKMTGQMPFGGTNYKEKYKHLPPDQSVDLDLNEQLILSQLGFQKKIGTSLQASYENKSNDQIYYQKGTDLSPTKEVVQFFARGNAHYWNTKKGPKAFRKFPSIKEALQFLWDKHSPYIEESSYKSFMKEWVG